MKRIISALFLVLITALPLFPATPELGYMAFVSMRDGHEQVYVMSEDASLQTRITNLPGYAYCSPKISPDGAYVAAVGYKQANEGRGSTSDIYVMGIDGSNLKKITEGGYNNDSPEWMADGVDLYVMCPDGSLQRKLTSDKNSIDAPLSHDRSKVYYVGLQQTALTLSTRYS